MPLAESGFPEDFVRTKVRSRALGDYVSRIAAESIRIRHMDEKVSGLGGGGGWSGSKGGTFNLDSPGQEILERTSCVIRQSSTPQSSEKGTIELRFTVSLPARGRTILGFEAQKILTTNLPWLIERSLLWASHDQQALIRHISSVEDQDHLRRQLQDRGLVAFVANGSVLPRASGASSLPMTGKSVIRFKSPPDLEIELTTPNGGLVRGMALRKGITVLSGGGFHGKSTLLEALELGIYDHIPGDGREAVVTEPNCVKIRAEDGRSVNGVDISPFISGLPGGKDTVSFSSEDASGSTSMSANIQEALEFGATSILIDEDSSATNLLIRDQRMQALIADETITPLVCKARALFNQHGVSTIIVIGGCGDYLSIADTVIGMQSYTPRNLTSHAQEVATRYPTNVIQRPNYGTLPARIPIFPTSILHSKPPTARGKSFISFPQQQIGPRGPEGDQGIDISSLNQMVEPGQAKLAAEVLRYIARRQHADGAPRKSMRAWVDEVVSLISAEGLDAIQGDGREVGDLVLARGLELGAALSRIRGLQMV
ncbi:MAG: hypothetical protein M1837_001859 [Sclerophora amabilis]|nr:MAG: hypothetical protein M1837_001859 [Sclerophora amabilis]